MKLTKTLLRKSERQINLVAYQVFDCGKPADCHHCKVDPSWNQSKYSSLEKARWYAEKWLYPYGGITLEPNIPYEYAEDCFIEIRTIKDEEK